MTIQTGGCGQQCVPLVDRELRRVWTETAPGFTVFVLLHCILSMCTTRTTARMLYHCTMLEFASCKSPPIYY